MEGTEEIYKKKYQRLLRIVKLLVEVIKKLKKKAFRDPLTGHLNREGFSEVVRYQLSASDRNKTTSSVLHIDMDNFKGINDTYGHAAGDRAIQAFAEILRSVKRGGDAVARFGGDEFIVFLPDTPLAGALHKASELCERAREEILIETRKGKIQGITLSIGVAERRRNETICKTIKRADSALYKVKKAGRNGFSS